jgi:hypothetical protein
MSRISRASLCITALACLVGAAPAAAHTIDVRGAEAEARTAAEMLGEVDQVRCWRPFTAIHERARRRAVCMAWWVHTPAGESCALFYEVRLARHSSRRLTAVRTFDPWCSPAPS